MMDAIEFVKQLRRMDEREVPKNCFIYPCAGQKTDSPEEVVAEVEEWAKENPIKTRQSEFLKQWPETALMQDGVITICPLMISAAYRDKNCACNKDKSDTCADCKRQFWLAEVEE